MASILRSIVASPRKQYKDGNNSTTLDLAYITPRLIVCSMPTSSYIQSWFHIQVKDLLNFLEKNHGSNWRIFNFRSEQTGNYRDGEFNGQVNHFPFPDHNAPPFHLIPTFVESLDKYLSLNEDNVAVLHCKAGQGRSGTMCCSYLMIQQGLTKTEATTLFTEKRMRSGLGNGVAIFSQRRYLDYVERYISNYYYDPQMVVEILRVTVINPQYINLELSCSEFTNNGRYIKPVYSFGDGDIVEMNEEKRVLVYEPRISINVNPDVQFTIRHHTTPSNGIFGGLTQGISILHSMAYFWINTFFETQEGNDYGSVEVMWDDMDGFLGTHQKGRKSFQRVKIEWRVVRSIG